MFGGGNSGGNFNNDAFGSFKQNAAQSSIFGSTQNKPFSAFNAASTSSTTPFGAPASGTSLFGSTAPKVGATGGLFGSVQSNTTPGSLFGSTQASAPQPSLFGSSASTLQKPAQSSLFGATVPNGTTIKFDPLKATDTMVKNNESKQINTKHMCITAMKQYESKSLEELRVEDYLANRKAGQSAGSTLFGTQNTSAASPQSGGLFGTNVSQPSIFQSNSPSFGAVSQTKPFSSFNPTSTSSSGTFGAPSGTGSLFGSANVPKLGNASGGIFGNAQNPGATGSLFGSSQVNAPKQSLFGGNAATSALQKPAQTSLFGAANVQQPSTTTGGGNVFANANASKPGGGLFGSTQNPTTAGSLFGAAQQNATQTSLFGNAGGGIFGNLQSTAAPGSLFGSAQPGAPQTSLFGSNTNALQKPAQSSLFGAGNTQQPGFTGNASFNSGGSPTILLGSNVDVASIQHAIIDAQLSTLPYGDSPILKMSNQSPKEERHKSPPATSSGLQRQLRFLSSKIDGNVSPSSPVDNSSVTASSAAAPTSNNFPRADLFASPSSGNFSYKPLISLPSVGFGAALGLNSSNRLYSPTGSSLQKNKSFLSQDRDELNSQLNSFNSTSSVRRAKALDVSVVHKSSNSPFSPASTANSNLDSYTPLASKQSATDQSLVVVPPLRIDSQGLDATDSVLSGNSNLTGGTTPLEDKTSTSLNLQHQDSEKSLSSAAVKLSRPEYYCQPPKEAIEETYADGVYNIEAGLTVGRLGYGSVFWRGPLRLADLNLDNIVHFRNKEIIVYPDETKKPKVGSELNRPAEVSLERVWPVGKEKQLIKDPDELASLKFREKLERICLKMGASFKDYQPATGTWQFAVPHF